MNDKRHIAWPQSAAAQLGRYAAGKGRYPNQRVLVVTFDNYVYLVPFVEEEDHYFLKTIIPSRKATREYLNQGDRDGKS